MQPAAEYLGLESRLAVQRDDPTFGDGPFHRPELLDDPDAVVGDVAQAGQFGAQEEHARPGPATSTSPTTRRMPPQTGSADAVSRCDAQNDATCSTSGEPTAQLLIKRTRDDRSCRNVPGRVTVLRSLPGLPGPRNRLCSGVDGYSLARRNIGQNRPARPPAFPQCEGLPAGADSFAFSTSGPGGRKSMMTPRAVLPGLHGHDDRPLPRLGQFLPLGGVEPAPLRYREGRAGRHTRHARPSARSDRTGGFRAGTCRWRPRAPRAGSLRRRRR